jgi:hypothetical protein
LKLRDNGISELSPSALSGLPDLWRLDLSSNDVKTLPRDLFQPVPRLERVDLSGNPLKCDCSLKWLWDWGKRKQARSTWSVRGSCDGGGLITDKSAADFSFCREL